MKDTMKWNDMKLPWMNPKTYLNAECSNMFLLNMQTNILSDYDPYYNPADIMAWIDDEKNICKKRGY